MKVFASLLLITLGMPAAAQTMTAPTVPQQAKAAKEKPICRREVATGSIMPKRTCHTKSEWVAIDQQNQNAADNFRNRPQPNTGRSGGF